MTDTAMNNEQAKKTECDAVERLLNEWRTRIDELKVQVDLAVKDVRDEVGDQLKIAENVFLAARSRLSNARNDTGADLKGMRRDIEGLLQDLKGVYDASIAVVRRGRG